jgi:hypothetical protein
VSETTRSLGSLAAATAVLGILLALGHIRTERLLAAYVLAVTAIALLHLVRSFRDGSEPGAAHPFEQALRRDEPAAPRSPELLRMERDLVLGEAEADHAHRRLLPLLRAVASARLAARHGLQLERQPAKARALLGEDVWELLRPDRPAPKDRDDPGVPRKQIAAAIERLESL